MGSKLTRQSRLEARRLSKVEHAQSAERFGRIETDITWIKWLQGAVLVVLIGQFVQGLLVR